MAKQIIELTDENFEKTVLKAEGPVLVDFWAEWCQPCRMVAPILESISVQYADKLTVGKLNVDNGPKTATQFGVRSIPTLLFFKDGKPMKQFVGFMSEKELKKNLDAALSG